MDGQEGRGYMRKLCEMSLLILALLLPFPVFAAGQEKVMGTVQIQCFVDLLLDGQTMELVFEEQDTTSFDHMLNGYMSNYEPNGVKVTKIVEDPSDLRLVYEPDNPDANADGYVEYPNVDTVTEMTNLIDSSRSYEASATAFNAAKNIAAKGLELFNS